MLAGWSSRFEKALIEAMLGRLGIAPRQESREIAAALIRALATKAQPIDRIFFDWRGGLDPGVERYPADEFRELASWLSGHEQGKTHPYWSDDPPSSMLIDEIETIWSAIAERDDSQPLNHKVNAIRRMGEAHKKDAASS